jgi:hypothetical protein
MRGWMTLFPLSTVLCVASALTGIQSFDYDSRTGMNITYWRGNWRMLALVYAAGSGLSFYGIYRRYPIVWKIGFVVLVCNAVFFVFMVWKSVGPQPLGWVVGTAATVFVPLIVLYWANHWRKQKEWFFGSSEEDG